MKFITRQGERSYRIETSWQSLMTGRMSILAGARRSIVFAQGTWPSASSANRARLWGEKIFHRRYHRLGFGCRPDFYGDKKAALTRGF